MVWSAACAKLWVQNCIRRKQVCISRMKAESSRKSCAFSSFLNRILSSETMTQRWGAPNVCLPPFRQAGNVWQGSGRPTLGRALKPALLSTPAKESLCVLLEAPLKWTGMPEWPPREPKPNSSLSILNRASALPFHARPSSSEVKE